MVWLRVISRVLALVVPIAVGGLAIAYSEELHQPPAGKDKKRPPLPVRVLTITPIDMAPRVIGYGTVAPARKWRAIARIEGEVVGTSDQLENGTIVSAGTELLRIDETDLLLSLAQIDAQLAALDVKEDTLGASLDISQTDLALSRADLQRQQNLQGQGVSTQTRVDIALRQELAARAKVTDLNNQLALNLAERGVLNAQRATVARSLEFTTLTAPYDLRVGTVDAEIGQVVNRGQTLFTAEGIDAVEIAAQFSFGQLGPLVRAMGEGGSVLSLKAKVRLSVPGRSVIWDASVDRLGEAIDARTQSTAIVVRVDQPVGQARIGQRPPLRRNMFVEVILTAPKRQVLATPLDAVRAGTALVVSPEGTLEKRQVEIAYTMGDIAVISAGLAEGDKLVVTDPSIAVPGMKVKSVEDKSVVQHIARAAAGGKGKSK